MTKALSFATLEIPYVYLLTAEEIIVRFIDAHIGHGWSSKSISTGHSVWESRKPSFGFVSTRFAGTDGVSLETQKWLDILCSKGCPVYFMAGKLDTDEDISHLVPLAFFQHPQVLELQNELFVARKRTRQISRRNQEIKEILKDELESFYRRFNFDILVIQNALAIPVNVPLGLAIAEFIAEQAIATIAHHHDFYWERQRFLGSASIDYLRQAFPPVHPCIEHVVINSVAGADLSRQTGVNWTLIPNVLDFKTFPAGIDAYT